MKYILTIISILLVFFQAKSQDAIFYSNDENDYSVLIDSNTDISKKSLNNGSLDYFIINDSSLTFKYYFSVFRSKAEKKIDLYHENYINSFKQGCGCVVTLSQKVKYNNFTGLQISIRAEKEGNLLVGYTISTITSDNHLYNITFLTYDEDLKLYNKIFNRFINSFVINDFQIY